MPPSPVGQPFQIVGPRQEGAQKVKSAAAESEACRFGWNPLKNLSCGFRRGVEAGRRLAPHIKKYIPGYSTSDVIDTLSPNEAPPRVRNSYRTWIKRASGARRLSLIHI